MSSTYNDIKIQLMATGDNNTTWGDNTNLNWNAMAEAVTGSADVAFSSANVTVSLTDTSASQTARNLRLNLTGTSGGARTLTVPSIEKLYLINNGLADAVTVKTAAGTGIAVPAGKTMWVFADGTNVVDVVTHATSLTLATALPVASGGTGANTAAAALTSLGGASLSANNTFTGNQVVSVNSASDAFRITQTGAGNVLVIEDSTNPDATPFVIDTNGRLIQGGTAAVTGAYGDYATYYNLGIGAIPRSFIQENSADIYAGVLEFSKSRAATQGDKTVVQSGDQLGTLRFSGADGTTYIEAARVSAVVDGTPGTNDMPGRLVFSTTADGASSPTERMRIDNAGNVGLGVGTLPSTNFYSSKQITGGTSANGFLLDGIIQSGVTSTFIGYQSANFTASAAFTLSSAQHFRAQGITVGVGSTITNQYGFFVGSGLTGATNNYGFYSNIASGSNRWNVYIAGTADNYFAGNVGIGITNPSYPLDVNGTARISGALTLSTALTVANGGTGQTSYTDGQLLIGNSTGNTLVKSTLTAGSGITITNGGGAITISASGSGGTVTNVTAGSGLSGGSITTTGTISLDLTNANSWTGKQTLSGSSSVLAAKLVNAIEPITVSATAATGTINYDVTTQSVLYYTTNASANWTVNLRASSGTAMNTALATGETITAAFLVTQGSTAYYNNVVQVDGTTTGVTTKWQGGSAPSSGNASSIDAYTYTVIKTGSATFTVLASQTKFA